MKGRAPKLALRKRLKVIRKWPIGSKKPSAVYLFLVSHKILGKSFTLNLLGIELLTLSISFFFSMTAEIFARSLADSYC